MKTIIFTLITAWAVVTLVGCSGASEAFDVPEVIDDIVLAEPAIPEQHYLGRLPWVSDCLDGTKDFVQFDQSQEMIQQYSATFDNNECEGNANYNGGYSGTYKLEPQDEYYARDGSPVGHLIITIRYGQDVYEDVYTVIQSLDKVAMYLGSAHSSSPESDGTTQETRLDGLGRVYHNTENVW